jgi:FkbM family methyltransferase
MPIVRAMPTRYGPIIRVHRHDLTNRLALFGGYGEEIVQWLHRLQPDDLFLDIGANTGIFSLIANDLMPNGRIFAFEPNPNLHDDLRFNIRINKASHVTPINVGLSDRTAMFFLPHIPGHTGSAALQRSDAAGPATCTPGTNTVITVSAAELDILVKEASTRRVCMKIDVEGHELNVLRGLRESGLLRRTAWAIVEIDRSYLERFGASVADLYDLMETEGLMPAKGRNFADHYDELFSVSSQCGKYS